MQMPNFEKSIRDEAETGVRTILTPPVPLCRQQVHVLVNAPVGHKRKHKASNQQH